jgi:hypothetical protein
MKEFFRNIIAVSLACLVLVSTMSFTINKHFCGDHLVSTSLIVKADNCGMTSDTIQKQEPSPLKGCSILKKNCCKDEIQLVEGQGDLKLDFSDLNFQQHVFITSFVITYSNLFEGLDSQIIPFKDYSPPLVVKDIQLLDGVFLI